MKKFIKVIFAPIICLSRRAMRVIMQDVLHDLYAHTDKKFFIMEMRLQNISKTVSGQTSQKKSGIYSDSFYLEQCYGSFVSAQRVLCPLLNRLSVESIIDFGCGIGTWLYVAKQQGVQEVYGIDGEYVNTDLLLIEKDEFHPADLEREINLDCHFDMAVSLEVAEHLHESSADIFVNNICDAAELVLFSAAHVGQGGDNHINCQPMSYWEKKFAVRGYKRLEIRPFFQKDSSIESWYRENMSLYVKKDKVEHISEQLRDIIER